MPMDRHGRDQRDVVRQHLIDPEICIRCNTCEETCPIDAITHDARNYVVDPAKCDGCNDCIAPCPTGAIDNWRQRARRTRPTRSTSSSRGTRCRRSASSTPTPRERAAGRGRAHRGGGDRRPGRRGAAAVVGRASLRQPLHGREARDRDRQRQLPPDRRRRVGATSATSCSTSARAAFPVLEGQTIGILPPGTDAQRQAAPRAPLLGREPARRRAPALQQPRAHGEARDRGPRRQARRGVASNFLCDLAEGRHGATWSARTARRFLMPNHPGAQPADGVHRHRLGADARDDRAAPAPHRARAKAAS